MPFSLDNPYSLFSIPIVYATALFPITARARLIRKSVGVYSNVMPREVNTREMLEKKGVPKHTIDRIVKLAGAHANGNEIFPLWAAAVLAANFAGVEQRTLNIASAAFISLRLLYNRVYVSVDSQGASFVRSLTFFSGVVIPIYLLIKAGNKLSLN